jgi:serine/threonine protein kinase
LGAITYEMLTGQNLFNARDLPDLINQVKKGNYYLNVKDLSSEIISFLNCMLQYNPKERLSAEQLAKHQFLTKDPDRFTKADVSQIDYKVENGRLIVNIFKNNTIQGLFPFKPDDMLNSLTMNLDEISKGFKKEKPNPCIKPTNPINTNIESRNNKKDINYINSLKPIKTQIFNSADIVNLHNKGKGNSQNVFHKRTSKDLPIKKDNLIKEDSKKISSKNSQKNEIYKIKFKVEIIDGIKENVQLNIKFIVNTSNILKHKSDLKEENAFKDEWIWEIDSNHLKNIDINDDYLMIFVDIIKGNSKETISANVDKISSGKAIGFKFKNNINFTLVPMI